MKATKLGLVLVIALSLGAAFSQYARTQEYKPKAEAKTLAKGPLVGVDDQTVVIKHISFGPGFVSKKHFHTGTVFVYILEGTLTVNTNNGKRTVSKGELVQEIPKQVTWVENMSAGKPLKFVVFQVGETGKPMMMKAK